MTVFLPLLFVHSVYSVGERAFVVRLDVNGTNANCAGSIITENSVLTTAQCVHGKTKEDVIVVQFTSNGVHRHSVDAVFIHPDFYSVTLYRDVSIVKTQTKFREPWRAVVINNAGLRNNLKIYQDCNMVGWLLSDGIKLLNGEKSSYRLEKTRNDFIYDEDEIGLTGVFVTLISGEECSRKIKDFGGHFDGNEKLCGIRDGRVDLCSIGAGGPLLCLGRESVGLKTIAYSPEIGSEYENRDSDRLDDPFDLLADFEVKIPSERRRDIDDGDDKFQIGIVSWGKVCSKVPSVFVRIDANYEWISNTVGLFDNKTSPLRTYTDVFRTASKSAKSFLKMSTLLQISFLTFSYPAVFVSL